MSFFIDSPDSHRLMTPSCRASTLETGGLFSTMFAGTITSKSLSLSDDLV
ncbi:BnaC03g16320D [Brassica napus]|uniref:BnaC03g16320D protein n=2 Tax=Brassica napus TaxID=3708 RepID=A0A078I8S1_BRANA|nr:BnaC03g16320D [Brassica napus]